MSSYSIKDLERLSGIKAHTLRIWERRYQLLHPERSDTNIRSYGDDDLRKLLNIATLIRSGWKISQASQLDKSRLTEEVTRLEEKLEGGTGNYAPFVNSLLVAALELNNQRFEQLLSSATIRFGLQETMLQIVNPLLRKIGLMWSVWNAHPGQEHFASNLIRQKLFSAIDQLVILKPRSKKFLLFLPEGENHEIGLLFASYWLQSEGYPVIYLGQDTPFEAVTRVAEVQKPDCLLTFFVIERPVEELQNYLHKLADIFAGQHIYIAGNMPLSANLHLPANVQYLASPEALMSLF